MSAKPQSIPVRPEWLAACREDPLEPAQTIVDPHHHLFDRPGLRYLLDEFREDLNCGHRVRATVFLQAQAMYRKHGPEMMRPVGETEFANGIAAMFASGAYGDIAACAGIVGFADMMLGDAVRPVLEAHVAAAGGPAGRFRGIRQIAAWDPNPDMVHPAYAVPQGILASPPLHAALAHLAALRLSFETYVFFHQLTEVAALARAFPDIPICVNHTGGHVGTGLYEGRGEEVFREWSMGLRELATCPNVAMKLGGLGMLRSGFGFENAPRPPSSQTLADAWRPWMETCIEVLGPDRCMFSSNFPVDKGSYSYGAGWNAMKRISLGASAGAKDDLFWRTAARFYRIAPEDLT